MKKILAALIVSLALPAAACRADGPCAFGRCGTINYCFGVKIFASLRGCGCNGCGCGSGYGVAGPWYTYWPLEAHFQTPAPTGYPYWPSPLVSSMSQPGAGTYQQVSYFQAPSYWYGH